MSYENLQNESEEKTFQVYETFKNFLETDETFTPELLAAMINNFTEQLKASDKLKFNPVKGEMH